MEGQKLSSWQLGVWGFAGLLLIMTWQQQMQMLSLSWMTHTLTWTMRKKPPRVMHRQPVQQAQSGDGSLRKKKTVYTVRRHDRSLCTQMQSETAALKAAIRKGDLIEGPPAAA